jgi:hypothetical protein
LKACGVFTGAAGKRNPVGARNTASQPGYAGKTFSSNGGAVSIAAVLPLQLIHQVPEMGGQFGIFRAKVLLQPFADGTADRSAGGPINLFTALVDSVGHRGFRLALVAVD